MIKRGDQLEINLLFNSTSVNAAENCGGKKRRKRTNSFELALLHSALLPGDQFLGRRDIVVENAM
jgi:hypothetical protein